MEALGGPTFPALVLEIMLKSIVLIAAALLLTWFMRRSSAAERHLYLSVAVISLLLLPLASVILPSWDVGFLPDPFTKAERAPGDITGPAGTDAPSPAAAGYDPPGEKAAADRAGHPRGGPEYGKGSTRWILVIWAAGAGILLVRLLGGKLYGYWIAFRAPAVEDERILDAVDRVSERVGFAGEIRVVESDHLKVPFISGLFRPRLLIPSKAKGWSIERIEAILHHEFAHIRRKDILVQFFAQIACCVYWINPLTWIMERKLFIERERACDDIAISLNIRASEYAGHLMEVMQELGKRRTHVWVMSAMAEGTDFKDRIISVLDPVAKRTTPRLGHSVALVAFAILLLLPLSSLRPWAEAGAGTGRGSDIITEGDGAYTGETGLPALGPEGSRGLSEKREDKQTDELIALLSNPGARIRERAAAALSAKGNEEVIRALVELLGDEDASVRRHASSALGEIGDRRAVPALIEIITDDPDARVREHAATALGQIGDARAVPALAGLVTSDPDPRVREHAAIALGQIGNK